MITGVSLENYGPLQKLDWNNLGKINLVIGGNGSGKTFLLKALYSGIRSVEEYRRGDDPRQFADIISEKIYWTFQSEKIGDLVAKGSKDSLFCEINYLVADLFSFNYEFKRNAHHKVLKAKEPELPRDANSIFLPAKEILSLHKVIIKSRDFDKSFGFDDTYLDLARALQLPTQKGKNFSEFAASRHDLEALIGGKVTYNQTIERWEYKQGNTCFPMGVTAEGIKKIAIIDTLLGNRYLSRDSIVFIDEPEANLHPTAISKFLDIIALLAESGIQFFLATHSYFVIKKLFLIAAERQMSIPLLAAEGDGWHSFDLKDGLPENEITNESIRLYLEEVDMALA